MKFNKFVASSVLLTIMSLTYIEASQKVYEYKAKARSANGLMGKIGDHAYACIKKKRKKHGKLKTVRNYGCYSQGTWGTSGWHTVAKFLVIKSSKTKKRKDGAICTSKHKSCSLTGWRYNRFGVCHQATNRFLYGANKYARINNKVRGYLSGYSSVVHFGQYGLFWNRCKRVCYR